MSSTFNVGSQQVYELSSHKYHTTARAEVQTGCFCSWMQPRGSTWDLPPPHCPVGPCQWNWEASMEASDLLGVQEAAHFNIWQIWRESVNGNYTAKKIISAQSMELLGRIYATDIKSSRKSLTFLRLIKFSPYLWKYLNLCKVNARKKCYRFSQNLALAIYRLSQLYSALVYTRSKIIWSHWAQSKIIYMSLLNGYRDYGISWPHNYANSEQNNVKKKMSVTNNIRKCFISCLPLLYMLH